MTIQLHKDPYTNLWVLPGEKLAKGGANQIGSIDAARIRYDVHDATAYRIHRGWKDNILNFQKYVFLHKYTYADKHTRIMCRQFIAKWIMSDLGPEHLCVKAIMDQIPFVPETYMHWCIKNHDAIMGHIDLDKRRGVFDDLLPPYVPTAKPSAVDVMRSYL